MTTNRQAALAQLAGKSPLQITNALKEFELYDAKSSQIIIDEVYQEFKTSSNLVDSVLKPVMLSVIDALLNVTKSGRAARKKGLTASRVIQECESFSYDEPPTISHDKNSMYLTEHENLKEMTNNFSEKTRPKFNREAYEDKTKMEHYKESKLNDNRKLIDDEYTGAKNLYIRQNNPDQRRNDPTFQFQAETDHIVPLKVLYSEYRNNIGLSDNDIKEIANSDYNLAMTSKTINRAKNDKTNKEFIDKNEQNQRERKDYVHIDEKTKGIMIEKDRLARKHANSDANKKVFSNVIGTGDKEQQKIIIGETSKNALNQSKDLAMGNIILFILKPIYYEIKDCFKNGVNVAENFTESIKLRFSRMKNYVLENYKKFLGSGMWDFVKSFVSSLVEGIINLFVGILKNALKVIKEGFKIFIQSAKVLFGKESNDMSPAQKGDAIVKIIGGSVIAIAGVGLEILLNKMAIPDPYSSVISILLSGIGSALFMYLLDKADIFGVKIEQRRDRILEIFNERIKDINDIKESYNIIAIETLRKHREDFAEIEEDIQSALKFNNIDTINSNLYKMADFFKVDLPYNNTKEFVNYFDDQDIIKI